MDMMIDANAIIGLVSFVVTLMGTAFGDGVAVGIFHTLV